MRVADLISDMSVSSTNIQAQLTPSTSLPKTTPEQEKLLQSSFSNNRNPTELDLILIAAEVGLSEDDVKVSGDDSGLIERDVW